MQRVYLWSVATATTEVGRLPSTPDLGILVVWGDRHPNHHVRYRFGGQENIWLFRPESPRRKPNSPVGTWVFVQLYPRESTPGSRLCLMAVPLLAVDWFLGDASHHGFANPSCVFCFIPCLTLHGVALRTREGRSLRATAQR